MLKEVSRRPHSNTFLGTVHHNGAVVVFSIASLMGQLAQPKRRGTELSVSLVLTRLYWTLRL